MTAQPVNPAIALFAADLIVALYQMPACSAGGPLHVQLDDYNVEDHWWRDEYTTSNHPPYQTPVIQADRVALRTVEQYPTTSVGDLSDFVLPDVEEPTAGAAQHIARHDPARVLADVEAKRALVDYWSRAFQNPIDADKFPGHDWDLVRGAARWTLRHLATPYASHPDYQAYWAL